MPKDLLECNNGEILNRCLSLYVKETRRVGWKQFPSRTIDMLLSGLKKIWFGVKALLELPHQRLMWHSSSDMAQVNTDMAQVNTDMAH